VDLADRPAGTRRVPEVEPVGRGDVAAAADAIARGFHDNEVWAWLLPRDRSRIRVLGRYYRVVLRRIFIPRGSAWTTEDRAGGALWLPSELWRAPPRDAAAEALTLMPHVGALRRGALVDRTFEHHHPREPHQYLAVLSVEPGRQGRGYGSALMRPGLERCDADGVGAYLETQRESNLPFYRRFGFEVTGEIEIPGGPPIWLMWRHPREDRRVERRKVGQLG
jgi:GNAT superfamily N-acetyltransferase